MALPKFIITMDGVFRLGMVNQHKELLKPGDQCIGGGYWRQVCPHDCDKSAISPIASEKSVGKNPTPSDKFVTPAEKLLSNLSFSHIVEILTVDDCT